MRLSDFPSGPLPGERKHWVIFGSSLLDPEAKIRREQEYEKILEESLSRLQQNPKKGGEKYGK